MTGTPEQHVGTGAADPVATGLADPVGTGLADRVATVLRVAPSGLRLITVPRSGSPLSAVLLRLPVGSADETPGEEGLAHALEHLVVRSSLAGGLVGDGARTSARTGREATVYDTVVRRADTVTAVTALGRIFNELAVSADELGAEVTAIREERAERSAEPAWRLREALLGTLWSGTPCAHPVLGSQGVLDSLTPVRLHQAHRKWYGLQGATLVIVADRPAELLPEVAATVAQWGPGRPGPAPRQPVRPASEGAAVTLGPVSGVAVTRPGFASAAAVLACDAVREATGFVVQTLPLRGWWCVWALMTAPGSQPARQALLKALSATLVRLTAPGGADWLRAAVLIPRLRAEGDVEAVARRYAEPLSGELATRSVEEVAAVLAEWRRWFEEECG
ncbi:M16 family metallopeptidase [Streptomyces sp. NPDC021093]|uniref:M16 family metallopeptidase n=1 Tax=Streptomyces sp. NPDC021093 TaxID=3365112 RepID=UPI00379189CC